jgi:hypothetical protein
VSPALLVTEVAELVVARPGRVRLAVDGAPPTRPRALADAVAVALRTAGRAVVVVDADDYLRPASLRLEHGRTDPDAFLDDWLDVGGLRREVLGPAAPDGSGRVLPRLWDARVDRAHRDRHVALPADGVVVLAGALLLGRGLPLDLAVHLRMSPAALARTLPDEVAWTLPAYVRYDAENTPTDEADLLVLADHPDRPAVRRG